MLSIEYVPKTVKLFRIELWLIVLASILMVILIWKILHVLMVLSNSLMYWRINTEELQFP